MGSCVSLLRNSESAVNPRLSLGSKTDQLVIPTSLMKDDVMAANFDRPINCVSLNESQISSPSRWAATFAHHDCEEESFYDSRPWLDSDCEDDFYSVNGDFTPSRGSTPVQSRFSIGTPRLNEACLDHVLQTPSSIDLEPAPREKKKKKLAELFKESFTDEDDYDDDRNQTIGKIEVKPTLTSTSYVNRDHNVLTDDREKQIRSLQCCLPSWVYSCTSFL